jgi:hypothetical protein
MDAATYTGIVENGQIRLPINVHLPEKATVYVVVPGVKSPSAAYVGSPRLVHPEQAGDFVKKVVEE